jgi:predicted HAD superfamily phosphohydrolase YqeG
MQNLAAEDKKVCGQLQKGLSNQSNEKGDNVANPSKKVLITDLDNTLFDWVQLY